MNASLDPNALILSASCMLNKARITFEILDVIQLQGGNNRVYQMVGPDGSLLLKAYYSQTAGDRKRICREYLFAETAWQSGIRNIPKPLCVNKSKNLAIYEFIRGKKLFPGTVKKMHVEACADFIEQLNGEKIRSDSRLQMASDACVTIEDHAFSIQRRIKKLSHIEISDKIDRNLHGFLNELLLPIWQNLSSKLKAARLEHRPLKEDWIVSPSDFGFHNMLESEDNEGELFFFDFEYAGWDDPVKMVCDYFCQPEIPVSTSFLEYFSDRIRVLMKPGYDFFNTIRLLLPLYRLKWVCIILNDFSADDAQRRAYAFHMQKRKEHQLDKAIKYVQMHLKEEIL